MTPSLVEPKAGTRAPTAAPTTERGATEPATAEPSHDGGRLQRLVAPMGGARIVSAAIGGLIATGLWIALFTVGLSVPSQPFRDGLLALAGGTPAAGAFNVDGTFDALYALCIIAFSYTPTNLALLCCTASLVGCLAYTATEMNGTPKEAATQTVLVRTDDGRDTRDARGEAAPPPPPGPAKADTIPLRPTISAITWGFFIYLFLISGTLLASQSPFSNTTADQYLRLAGTASLLAFVVGWRPELITRLVTQIGQSRINSGEGSPQK